MVRGCLIDVAFNLGSREISGMYPDDCYTSWQILCYYILPKLSSFAITVIIKHNGLSVNTLFSSLEVRSLWLECQDCWLPSKPLFCPAERRPPAMSPNGPPYASSSALFCFFLLRWNLSDWLKTHLTSSHSSKALPHLTSPSITSSKALPQIQPPCEVGSYSISI